MTYEDGAIRNRLVLAGCVLLLFATAEPAIAQENQTHEFDIDEKELGEALTEFGIATGSQVLFKDADVRGKTANGVEGVYTSKEAVEALLENTGVDYRVDGNGTLLVGSEYVRRVSLGEGSAPAPLRVAQLAQDQTIGEVETPITDEDEEQIRDVIVVTGTNIRGVGSVGSPVIVVTREDIDRQGFATTQDLLRSIPQFLDTGENSRVTAPNVDGGVPPGTVSPNVRGLGTGATLTLVNGRRIASGGGDVQVTDVSLIPLSAIERVEILTDGASAIYGTDAIAGVVNFVLRDDFDGAETRLRVGAVTEGSSQEYRASQTFGRSWGDGNALVSYEYYRRNNLDTRSKDFTADAPDPTDILPQSERHSVFFSGKQDMTAGVGIFGDASYSVRDSELFTGRFSTFGDQISQNQTEAEQYGVTLGATVELYDGWQAELATTYGASASESEFVTNDVPVGDSTTDFSTLIVDLIADGPIFEIPGGAVKLAVGGQFRNEQFEFITRGTTAETTDGFDRDVFGFFGELYFPIVGASNRQPGLYSVDFTVAGRYEDYSDFGSSTDPKLGLRYAPIERLNLRGTYGTSFKAPNTLQLGGGFAATPLPGAFLVPPPGETSAPNLLISNGANVDLGPEASETYTFGFDYSPQSIDGLTLQATYFDISFDNRIADPRLGSILELLSRPDLFGALTLFEGDPGFDEQLALLFPTNPVFNPFGVAREDIGAIFDGRLQNIAATQVSGLDVSIDYATDTHLGELRFGLFGSYLFEFLQQNIDGGGEEDILNRQNQPVDLRLRGDIGWSRGGASAALFINYVDSYESDITGILEPVDSWTTIDFNFAYDFENDTNDFWDGSRLSLNIVNLLDEEPPFVDRAGSFSDDGQDYDGANANALGRFVALQLEKFF